MAGQDMATDNVEQGLNTASRINPSIVRKISTMKRQRIIGQRLPAYEELVQGDTRSSDQSLTVSQESQSNARQRSSSSGTRCTISTRPDAFPSQATNSIEASPFSHNREQSETTLDTDLRSHKGHTATIHLPVVGEELTSRLEGLQQFRAWNERIHDTIKEQQKDQQTTVSVPENESLLLQNKPQSVQSRPVPLHREVVVPVPKLDAPTPFSSPKFTPTPVTSKQKFEHIPCPLASTPSPPAFDLYETDNVSGYTTRPRSKSKSKFIIAAASDQALDNRARSPSGSTSQHPSQTPSRSCSRAKSLSHQKRHPPTSFPPDFYEKYPDVDPTFPYSKFENSLFETNLTKPTQTTPSVSPRSTPALPSTDFIPHQASDPPSTSHDIYGRPSFYETIHHYTTCPHTSPPANRPLCLSAQPRLDPVFHLTQIPTSRSIIPGSCFNCDTQARRSAEDNVLEIHAAQVAELTHQLTGLVEQLELLSPTCSSYDEAYTYDKHSARLHGPSVFPEDAADLDYELGLCGHPTDLLPLSDDSIVNNLPIPQPQTPAQKSYQARIISQIRALEAQIDEVRENQDKAVKKVWCGYTSRWGPATLGIQRGTHSADSDQDMTKGHIDALLEQQRRRIDDSLNMPAEIGSGDDLQAAGVDEKESGIEGTATVSNDGRPVGSKRGLLNSDSGSSRSDAEGSNSRVEDRNKSQRDLPGAREPGEGRMRVGWIRDDR